MGLMFARRRMEEAAKRASNKSKAQSERHKEAKDKHGIVPPASPSNVGNKNADSKGTK